MTTKTKTKWRTVRLGDFAEVNPPVNLVRGKEYPFMDMANVTPLSHTISWPEKKAFTGTGARFDEGDTLFARITPCLENGKITQVVKTGGPGFGSTEFYVLRGKERVSDNDFVFYLTRTYRIRKIAEANMVGASGRQRVERTAFENILVQVPEDINTQKRIAEVLAAFDEKIENNNRIIKTLEEMAQAIFKEWFVNFKFPGYEKVKMVDSELGEVPEGWEVKKVKEICDQIMNGGTPRREVREYWSNGSIPWVTTSELRDQVIIGTTEKISTVGYENSSVKLLPPNTIIIALYASPTLGRLGLLKIEATTNQACSALVVKDEIGYGYLFYWLLNQREYLQGLAVGAAQQNINQEVIRELNVLIPYKQLLKRFQEVVSKVFDTLTSNRKENQKLTAMRDLLLPKLMSGEIRI